MTQASPAARPQGGFGAPFAALVVGALAMGISPIFVRLADVGPFASAFWRVTLALPLLWAWLRLAEARRRRPTGGSAAPTLLAGLAFAGDLFFWHLSIVTTSVANATFFATTRADLGGGVRLAAVPRARGARACWPGSRCASPAAARCWRRACISAPPARSAISTASRPACSSASISSPCRRRGATHSAARVTFDRHRHHRGAAVDRRARARARDCCRTACAAIGALARHGLDQPRRRPGPAVGRARPAAGGVFLAGDLPRGDRRRRLCLSAARRAGFAGRRGSADC